MFVSLSLHKTMQSITAPLMTLQMGVLQANAQLFDTRLWSCSLGDGTGGARHAAAC